MGLENIIEDTNEILSIHQPNLEKEFGLDLSGFDFGSMDELADSFIQKCGNSRNPLIKLVYKASLRIINSKVSRGAIKVDKEQRRFYINPDNFQTENPFYNAELTFCLIHECFHTLFPLTKPDKEKDIFRFLYDFWKCIKSDKVEEGLVEFYSIQYLRRYHEIEEDNVLRTLKKDSLPDEVRESMLSRLLSLLYLKQYVDIQENDMEEKYGKTSQYQRLKHVFNTQGYNGLVIRAKHPNSLLKAQPSSQ